jgi:hypothetical protein
VASFADHVGALTEVRDLASSPLAPGRKTQAWAGVAGTPAFFNPVPTGDVPQLSLD